MDKQTIVKLRTGLEFLERQDKSGYYGIHIRDLLDMLPERPEPDDSSTVCVRCVHYINTHDGMAGGPPPDTWFYQKCGCDAAKVQEPFDVVLGIMPVPRAPNCRDVNEGSCPHFKEL